MTWVDAAIVLIFLFFVVTAFQSGLVREVIAIASVVLGVVLAGLMYDDLASTLLTAIDNETTANVIAFLIIFGGVALAGQLLAMVVHPMITILQLGLFDQLLGAAFGAMKAFVIIEALLILMVTYPRYDMDERIRDSDFATLLLDLSKPVTTILPDIFEAQVDAFDDGEITNPLE
ncbi:MAG TPA: CvpA family protein [Dehalococcoidia bacterium]|nr:CvpA family protein [Dehalococcoidia bacterium]